MKKEQLHNIDSTGFKIPKTYFDTFEDCLMDELEQSNTISGIQSPGFTAPKDYLNTLDEKILKQLDQHSKPIIQLRPRRTFYYIAGVAASLLILLAILTITNTTNEISAEMVEVYFENSDLDSYELAELLSDADLLEDDFIITEPSYNQDNLESYLLEHADIETILD